jgi:hypothetical protein
MNGHQLRGGWFHTLNFRIFNIGIMFSWGELPNGYRKDKIKIEFFKLF